MLAREQVRATEAQANPPQHAAAALVRRALELLGRASADWRNGGGCESGPLHWPVSVNLAQRLLRQALEALDLHPSPRNPPPLCQHCGGTGFEGDEPCEFCCATGRDGQLEDALRGSIWWNSITRPERAHWLAVADSAIPADAWEAYKAGGQP